MNKDEALEVIRKIQCGNFKRPKVGEMPTGSIARAMWNDSGFSYGMEYGCIHGLMMAFDIDKDEI